MMSADGYAVFILEFVPHAPRSVKGAVGVDFINCVHGSDIFLINDWLVIDTGSGNSEEFCLSRDTDDGMVVRNERGSFFMIQCAIFFSATRVQYLAGRLSCKGVQSMRLSPSFHSFAYRRKRSRRFP